MPAVALHAHSVNAHKRACTVGWQTHARLCLDVYVCVRAREMYACVNGSRCTHSRARRCGRRVSHRMGSRQPWHKATSPPAALPGCPRPAQPAQVRACACVHLCVCVCACACACRCVGLRVCVCVCEWVGECEWVCVQVCI